MAPRRRLAADRRTTPPGGTSLTITEAALATSIAAVVALLAMFPIRRHARTLGFVDAPNERSSHRFVTPRSGGIGIILATAASLWFLGSSGHVGVPAWMLFGAASLIGAVGVLDDRFGLPPVVRLVAHLGAAMIVVGTLGPVSNLPLPAPMNIALPAPLLSWTFSLLWIVAVTNFFNFMDGIDGLAGAQAAATCAGVAAAAWSADAASLAVAAGGACLGFLVHNWPPARVFMGDSGSGFLGFVLAGLPFLAPPARRSDAVLAVAVGMMLFLLDPVVTLFRRARAGKNILRAHREHLYQQLVAPEEPAGPLTAAYAATALFLALAGAAGYRFPALMWFGCIASVCAFLAVWRRASHAQRARAH